MRYRFGLDGHTPVPWDEADLVGWARWVQGSDKERQVAFTEVGIAGRGGVRLSVSTFFLALDHGPPGGPPILFETLIRYDGVAPSSFFAPRIPLTTGRYVTWEDAVEGHNEAVEWAQDFLAQIPDDEIEGGGGKG